MNTISSINSSEYVPIKNIIEELSPADEKVRFCYLIFQETLKSLIANKYSDFDAQTTSNCCHGMSARARSLIASITFINKKLTVLFEETQERLRFSDINPDWQIPENLAELSQFYILNYIREVDPLKGIRSSAKKLQSIANLSYTALEGLVKNLQKKHSNRTAFQYLSYLEELPKNMRISSMPVEVWGKFISLRVSHGISYAPCIYSMQVLLAHLIFSKAMIAIINDIQKEAGVLSKRYVKIMRGDGKENFYNIKTEENDVKEIITEPVVVFWGYAHNSDPDLVSFQMDSWLDRFSNLVLACDTHYPQFPEVRNDPKFERTPIVPDKKDLEELINLHRNVEGVSVDRPYFYFLNHIYVASLEQIVKEQLPPYVSILPALQKSQKSIFPK